MREWLATTLADLSNKEADEVDRDIERDLFMTASAAKDYGLVDEVITSRKVRPGSITR
jgi:ATP-dependent Clp protease protease subunit